MKYRYFLLFAVIAGMCILPPLKAFSQAFTHSLDIPVKLDSSYYEIYADTEMHDFGDGVHAAIRTWAYNHTSSGTNTYLGPVLTWKVGRQQTTHIINRLGTGNPTTVHWHGANIPASQDGGPHQFFAPGDTFKSTFPVIDAPTNLWYHPHAEDLTYTQVQMGLAGMIVVEDASDPIAPTLPRQYGTDDLPLVIQDLHFDADSIDTLQQDPRQAIVNGTMQPTVNVPPQLIRFRILCGSTRIAYILGFVGAADTAVSVPSQRHDFKLLASDGGYLPDSVRTVDSLLTGPGIRNDILVDLSQSAGDTLYLVNIPGGLKTIGAVGAPPNAAPKNYALMQIVVGQNTIGTPGQVPASLPAIPALGPPNRTRNISLNGRAGNPNPNNPTPVPDSLKFNINHRQFEFNVIDDTVNLGDIEDWRIINTSVAAHPFHIHQIQFFVQSVTDLQGNPLPMPVEFLGPKDDILVPDSQIVTFRTIFNTYGTPMPFDVDTCTYMYHCHILTHEDGYYVGSSVGGGVNTPPTISERAHWGMMQQFVVWNGLVSRDFSQPLGKDMVLFPNPAADEIHLNGESAKLSTVRIYDLQGKLLLEKMLAPFKGTTSIDISSLPAGMVALEWQSPEGRFVKKVVVRR